MAKHSVLLLGATGSTGSSILEALLSSGNFTVVAGVRPASASKPAVNALKARGVEIRILDLQDWTVDQLAESLKGIDTVISTIYALDIHQQKPLIDAAKKAGVKRFIPDDWATACVRGVRRMHDAKLEIHEYIKQVGIGYTFVDVSWWMQLFIPPADPVSAYPTYFEFMNKIYGTGNVKTAVIDRHDIGKFVSRIIADERTLNQYVFCWSQEVTQNEAYTLAERVTGRKFDTANVSGEQLLHTIKNSDDPYVYHRVEYIYSLYIRGDNTVENAKKPEYGGALDAKELYPDIDKELSTLEDFVKDLYPS